MKIRIGDWEANDWLGWLIAIPVLLLVGLLLVPILLGVGAFVIGVLLFVGAILLGVLGLVLLPILGIPLLILAPILLPFLLIGLIVSIFTGSPLLIFLFVAALVYLAYRWWKAIRVR